MSTQLTARSQALAVFGDVMRRRRPLDSALSHLQGLAPRDAGFARAIVSETLRRLGQLEALVGHFISKPPSPHRSGPTLEILYLASCELLFLGVAPHAAVDGANRLAQDNSKAMHFKPLINAVLRRVAREGKAIVDTQDAAWTNTPDWLRTRWANAYGDDVARAIGWAHLRMAPTDIVVKSFDAPVPDGEKLFGNVVRLHDNSAIDSLVGFEQGHFWVQDAAASLPALLLGAVKDQRVADLCAAPGGKTMQLALAGAKVTAVERDSSRLERLDANLSRTKLHASLVNSDIYDFSPALSFPLVLLDAPCTATGTIRRHPELPWIKGASDVVSCAQSAGVMLDHAATLVAPGGMLVFCVCSLEPEESIDQIEAFLRRTQGFQRLAVAPNEVFGHSQLITAKGDLRTLPSHFSQQGGMDGFYAARLRREL